MDNTMINSKEIKGHIVPVKTYYMVWIALMAQADDSGYSDTVTSADWGGG